MFCLLDNLEPKEKTLEISQSASINGPVSPIAKTTTTSFPVPPVTKTNTTPLPTSPTGKTTQTIIGPTIIPRPTSPIAPNLASSPKEIVGVMDLLDKAIAEGKHAEAAQLAKEVSKSQISAKLVGSTSTGQRKLSKSEKIRSECVTLD